MQINSKYRVAIYCRVATADQLAIDHQENSLRAYAEEHGYSNPVSYLDNGYSGSNFDRPAFSRLNTDLLAGEIDTVLVCDISRIGRNHIEVGNWIDGLEKNGVALISAGHRLNGIFSPDYLQKIAAYMRSM